MIGTLCLSGIDRGIVAFVRGKAPIGRCASEKGKRRRMVERELRNGSAVGAIAPLAMKLDLKCGGLTRPPHGR